MISASDKQIDFLNKLLDEAADMLRQRDEMTGRDEALDIIGNDIYPMRPDRSTLKAEASQDIGACLANNRALRSELDRLRATTNRTEVEPEFVGVGMYTLNGRIFKVLPSRSGNGRCYAKELIGESATGYSFAYAKGAMYRLRSEHRMSAEDAAEWGQLTGSCCCCGTLLTDPRSVKDGIGPVCSKKYFA